MSIEVHLHGTLEGIRGNRPKSPLPCGKRNALLSRTSRFMERPPYLRKGRKQHRGLDGDSSWGQWLPLPLRSPSVQQVFSFCDACFFEFRVGGGVHGCAGSCLRVTPGGGMTWTSRCFGFSAAVASRAWLQAWRWRLGRARRGGLECAWQARTSWRQALRQGGRKGRRRRKFPAPGPAGSGKG